MALLKVFKGFGPVFFGCDIVALNALEDEYLCIMHARW